MSYYQSGLAQTFPHQLHGNTARYFVNAAPIDQPGHFGIIVIVRVLVSEENAVIPVRVPRALDVHGRRDGAEGFASTSFSALVLLQVQELAAQGVFDFPVRARGRGPLADGPALKIVRKSVGRRIGGLLAGDGMSAQVLHRGHGDGIALALGMRRGGQLHRESVADRVADDTVTPPLIV